EALEAAAAGLGNKDEAARNAAAADLVRAGPAAVPVLRQLANNPDDPDTAKRARDCLKHVEGSDSASLTSAAVRLLAARRPDGAAAALLGYLPYADDDRVAEEVQSVLATLAVRDGKPDPAVTAALEDKNPVRRAAA